MADLRPTGFSLTELLVVLALAAVLLQLVMPSYAQLLTDSRLQSEAQRLQLALGLARTEAVNRQLSVVFCPREAPSVMRCGNDSAQGWLVFGDVDEDGQPDQLGALGTSIIREFPPSSLDVLVRSNRSRVRFRPDGSTPDNQTIRICPSVFSGTSAWQLTLNNAGRLRLSRSAQGCRDE